MQGCSRPTSKRMCRTLETLEREREIASPQSFPVESSVLCTYMYLEIPLELWVGRRRPLFFSHGVPFEGERESEDGKKKKETERRRERWGGGGERGRGGVSPC